MSVANKLLQAAAGNAGEAVYVDDLFSTTLYTGISKSSGFTDINTGVDCNTDGGMVWIKQRSGGSTNHGIWDTERTNGYYLPISTDNGGNIAQASASTPFIRTTGIRFSASGGTVNHGWFNDANEDHVVWSFKKQEKFFDIVEIDGSGGSGFQTFNHNLGSTPGMIIVKRFDGGSENWFVWHRGTGGNNHLKLNNNVAIDTGGGVFGTPTDTTFSVQPYIFNMTSASNKAICYLFAHDEQEFGENSDEAIIKCGSYTGNNSATGQTIDLGFEPQWVMIKNVDAVGNWNIYDSMRGIVTGGNEPFLHANAISAENSTTDRIQLTSTGFQVLTTSPNVNSAADFIYMAIARPHKPASEFAATDLFAIDTKGGTTPNPPLFTAGFPVDMAFNKNTGGNGNWRNVARLMQGKSLIPNNNNDEDSDGSLGAFDYQNGWRDGTTVTASAYAWMWRRAKGFFDVVISKGASGYTTIKHNLGVAPELAIAKVRDYTPGQEWYIWVPSEGVEKAFNFDNGAIETHPYLKNFTSTTMDTNLGGGVYTYIYYLFASVDGISKVGSYSGTGSDVTVDCGFSAGARFVLIKRSDSTGDWYLYDSSRGIVAGNDPYILLNSNAAGVTNTDYIDPDNSGFIVTSSAPAALNNSGGSYIFYAIA